MREQERGTVALSDRVQCDCVVRRCGPTRTGGEKQQTHYISGSAARWSVACNCIAYGNSFAEGLRLLGLVREPPAWGPAKAHAYFINPSFGLLTFNLSIYDTTTGLGGDPCDVPCLA